ncbi:unnamed protein product [Rhizophagus irregularis]|uniref:Uncharacterized protein n=1 Tax=Rhizophagus irregularis TaxID=588596 RepID=A0A915YMP7_9GLOM|nr:unnamed protein product [Rhizophagus irregularis]CAB5293648.1 unnamed protein product [Rhizophagus irregularis]
MSNNIYDNALYDNTYDNISYNNTYGYIPYDNTCENTLSLHQSYEISDNDNDETSEKVEGMVRRAAYECAKSDSHTSQVTSDPTKRRNANSSRTSYP